MEEVPEITHRVYLDVDIEEQRLGTAFTSTMYHELPFAKLFSCICRKSMIFGL